MNDRYIFKKIKWYHRLLYIVPALILFACSFSFLMPKVEDISASAATGAGGNMIGNDTKNFYTWTNGFQSIFVPYEYPIIGSQITSNAYSLLFPLPATIGGNLMTSFPYGGGVGTSFTERSTTTGTIQYPRDLYSTSRVDNLCRYKVVSTVKGTVNETDNLPTYGEFLRFEVDYNLYSVESLSLVQEGMMIVDLDLFFDSLCNYTTFIAGNSMNSAYISSTANAHMVFTCEFMRFVDSEDLQPWSSYMISTPNFTTSVRTVSFESYEEGSAESLFPGQYFEYNGRKIAFMRSATLAFISSYNTPPSSALFFLTMRLYPHHFWSDTRLMNNFDYRSFAPVVEYTVNPIQWLTDVTATFFEAELYPGFTFGGVFFTLAMICCAVAFLKVFAGG